MCVLTGRVRGRDFEFVGGVSNLCMKRIIHAKRPRYLNDTRAHSPVEDDMVSSNGDQPSPTLLENAGCNCCVGYRRCGRLLFCVFGLGFAPLFDCIALLVDCVQLFPSCLTRDFPTSSSMPSGDNFFSPAYLARQHREATCIKIAENATSFNLWRDTPLAFPWLHTPPELSTRLLFVQIKGWTCR